MAGLQDFERAYVQLKSAQGSLVAEGIALASNAFQGAPIRAQYIEEIRAKANYFLKQAECGNVTPRKAARLAYEARNKIRHLNQSKMSDFGRAVTDIIETDKTFKQLWNKRMAQVKQNYARAGKVFDQSNAEHLDDVAREMIKGSGKSRGAVSPTRLKAGGTALLVVSLALITIDIYYAQDKSFAISKNVTTVATGAAGFWTGAKAGALTGSVVGPWGTVIGALVGGILFSLAGEELHARLRGMRDPELDRIVRRATGWFDFDEDQVGTEIAYTFGSHMNRTASVFAELNEKRNADVDEIVQAYVSIVKAHIDKYPAGIIHKALKTRKDVRDLLASCLDDGWTTSEEYADMRFLNGMR